MEGTNVPKDVEDEELAKDDTAARSIPTVVPDDLEPVDEDKGHVDDKCKEHAA